MFQQEWLLYIPYFVLRRCLLTSELLIFMSIWRQVMLNTSDTDWFVLAHSLHCRTCWNMWEFLLGFICMHAIFQNEKSNLFVSVDKYTSYKIHIKYAIHINFTTKLFARCLIFLRGSLYLFVIHLSLCTFPELTSPRLPCKPPKHVRFLFDNDKCWPLWVTKTVKYRPPPSIQGCSVTAHCFFAM